MILIGSVLLCISYQQVPASLILSSSDERVISALSEALCISALQSTEKYFLHNYLGKASSNFFHWLQKPRRILSSDSSVIIYKVLEEEIIENAKILLEDFHLNKEGFDPERNKPKHYLWTPSAHSKLENMGGPDFSAWTSEYIPAYRLQIDAAQLKDVKFEGWRKSAENKWEVLLTHSQMVISSFLSSFILWLLIVIFSIFSDLVKLVSW